MTIYNSIFNNDYGIYIEGISDYYSDINFFDNAIYHNDVGGDSGSDYKIDVSENYWGDPTGPYHESLNPEGKGNPIYSDKLGFTPFLNETHLDIHERPIAHLSADKTTVLTPEIIIFNGSASTGDTENITYFFDFDDGTDTNWTNLSIVEHSFSSPDSYQVSLKTKDEYGIISENTATVEVNVKSSYIMSGYVFKNGSSKGIEGARITIEYHQGENYGGGNSGNDGLYRIHIVKKGTFNVTISAEGYKELSTSVTITSDFTQDFYLTPEPKTDAFWVNILIIFIIVIIGIITILLIKKRKKSPRSLKEDEKDQENEEEGPKEEEASISDLDEDEDRL
jgi:hypothetical protein